MSLVTSRVGLRHRCTIERNAGGSEDDWGNPQADDWQTHLDDVPCRAWTNAAREPIDDETQVVLEDRRLTLTLGTDVTEHDRIASVTSGGTEIFPGPMDIDGVLRFTDHIELILQEIR